jgi:hypothetical protein
MTYATMRPLLTGGCHGGWGRGAPHPGGGPHPEGRPDWGGWSAGGGCWVMLSPLGRPRFCEKRGW